MSTALTHIETNKQLVPKLRFKEFDGNWIMTKVLDFAPLQRGFDLPVVQIQEGPFPVVFSNGALKTHSEYKAKAPGVVTGRSGTIGKVTFVKEDYWPHNTALWVTNFYDNDPKYVYYFYINIKLDRFGTGSGVPTLNRNDVHAQKRAIPTLPEQQKIASFLFAVDQKIQQLTKKKELLEQYKKGVMQQLFSGELRFKDENGNDYPDWEEKRLGDVGKIVSGLTYSPDDIDEEGVLVLRSSNVHGRQVTFDDNVYVSVTDHKFNPVEENDILICVRNGSKRLIGKNALIKGKAIGVAFGAFMTVYRSSSNLFLFHYFDTVDYKKEVHKNLGATINSINGSDLKKLKVPFPSSREQQKISNYLSSIDTKIESVNNQEKQTQTFKKGLLQQMFVAA